MGRKLHNVAHMWQDDDRIVGNLSENPFVLNIEVKLVDIFLIYCY